MGARRGRWNRILATCSYSTKYPAGGSRWNLLPLLSPTVLWMYSWLYHSKLSPNGTIMTMRRVLRPSLGVDRASCPQWWNKRLRNGTSSGSPSRSVLPIQPLPSSGAGTSMSSVCGTPLLAAAWGNSSLVTKATPFTTYFRIWRYRGTIPSKAQLEGALAAVIVLVRLATSQDLGESKDPPTSK